MLVSILVPMYNTSKYLDRCMKSLLNQTYSNLEVVLINDGSTDDSLEKAKAWQAQDHRIQIYSYPNGGISKTRNRALENAQGDFVTFVDSDDFLDTRMVEALVKEAQEKDLDVVQCGFVMDFGPFPFYRLASGHKTFDTVEAMHMLAKEKYLNNYPWGKLYKKSCFQDVRFPENMKGFEDTCTVFRALANGKRIGTIPNRYYHYAQRMGSLTNCMSLPTVYLMRDAYEYQEKRMHELFPQENFSFDMQYYNVDMVIIYTLILFCHRKDDPKFIGAKIDWKKLPFYPIYYLAYYAWLGLAILKLSPRILKPNGQNDTHLSAEQQARLEASLIEDASEQKDLEEELEDFEMLEEV
ncbi:MAG: glycosyltransferase [Allobaculum sp.]|nr:glycosyltransferase [Allobaculum sp.]